MKIDIFCHFLPRRYFEGLDRKAARGGDTFQETEWLLKNLALSQIEVRLRLMERYPDVLQVLTIATPPLETLVGPEDAAELSRIGNDEMAELVARYPDRFVGAVACLPLNDIDATIREAERAIEELKFRGVQVFTNMNGEPLDSPRFKPLYAKLAEYDLPIWIHPWNLPASSLSAASQEWVKGLLLRNMVGWPFQTTIAMIRLATSGIFEEYPGIKFITHHCGGMVPFFAKRIGIDKLRAFYNDTALYGNTSALSCGYDFFGPDHVLFGTDMPLGSGASGYGYTSETIRSVEDMAIPAEDKEKIFRENAMRLLKLTL